MMADAARIESQEDIAKLRTSTKNKQQQVLTIPLKDLFYDNGQKR